MVLWYKATNSICALSFQGNGWCSCPFRAASATRTLRSRHQPRRNSSNCGCRLPRSAPQDGQRDEDVRLRRDRAGAFLWPPFK